MSRIITFLALNVLLLACNSLNNTPNSNSIEPGTLRAVAALDINPGNIALAKDGRIFSTVHQFREAPYRLIEITDYNSYRPWPNEAWNSQAVSSKNSFQSLLGITIDGKDRLWVIDNGVIAQGRSGSNIAPVLYAFDVNSGALIYRHDFTKKVGPIGSFIQDLVVDETNEFV